MDLPVLRRAVGALVLGAAAALPAYAGVVVDFEDAVPTIFSNDSVTSGGFTFTSDGFGFSGIDSAGAFVFGNAPTNATGQFLFMLNNDGMVMTQTGGGGFRLKGFDAAFIAPLPNLTPNVAAGELVVLAETEGGSVVYDTFILPASDGDGNFGFGWFDAAATGAEVVKRVGFFACVYTGNVCSFNDLTVPAQFALDNISVIPEPGSAALALVALGLLVSARRRVGA